MSSMFVSVYEAPRWAASLFQLQQRFLASCSRIQENGIHDRFNKMEPSFDLKCNVLHHDASTHWLLIIVERAALIRAPCLCRQCSNWCRFAGPIRLPLSGCLGSQDRMRDALVSDSNGKYCRSCVMFHRTFSLTNAFHMGAIGAHLMMLLHHMQLISEYRNKRRFIRCGRSYFCMHQAQCVHLHG